MNNNYFLFINKSFLPIKAPGNHFVHVNIDHKYFKTLNSRLLDLNFLKT